MTQFVLEHWASLEPDADKDQAIVWVDDSTGHTYRLALKVGPQPQEGEDDERSVIYLNEREAILLGNVLLSMAQGMPEPVRLPGIGSRIIQR